MSLSIEWLDEPVALLDAEAQKNAEARQVVLTKPPGALGRLEEVAVQLAALQAAERPCVDKVQITVFAADHGVVKEGVSAFPQEVTAEMVKNFSRGGAAISVLAKELDAELEVINLGTVNDTGPLTGVINIPLGSGSENFAVQAAMNEDQLRHALEAGRKAVERAQSVGAQLFIGGEMGIGNTTAATALACVLLDEAPEKLTGPGTGLSTEGVTHKMSVIQTAIDLHKSHIDSPLEALRRVGGFEIAALVGAYITSAKQGLPVLVDGFISSSAALLAENICPGVKGWFLFSHNSAEPGHRRVLEALDAKPLLDLQMRLGEGSGAAIAVPLLRMACSLHNNMATFAEAQVSEKN